MRQFIGYCEDEAYPFRMGEKIVVPAGITVRSYDPKRKERVSVRRQTVVIDHFIPGQSINISMCIGTGQRAQYPGFEPWFDLFDQIHDAIRVEKNEAKANQLHRLYRDLRIPTLNPTVTWRGRGGWWTWVDMNDLTGNPVAGIPSPEDYENEFLEILSAACAA